MYSPIFRNYRWMWINSSCVQSVALHQSTARFPTRFSLPCCNTAASKLSSIAVSRPVLPLCIPQRLSFSMWCKIPPVRLLDPSQSWCCCRPSGDGQIWNKVWIGDSSVGTASTFTSTLFAWHLLLFSASTWLYACLLVTPGKIRPPFFSFDDDRFFCGQSRLSRQNPLGEIVRQSGRACLKWANGSSYWALV